MTFLLIRHDGSKGESNDDEALPGPINHKLPGWMGHSYKNNFAIHRLNEYCDEENSTVIYLLCLCTKNSLWLSEE